MSNLLWVAVSGLAVLIGLSGNAFAGVAPVPEPASLTLLAVGFGGVAAIRYLRRK